MSTKAFNKSLLLVIACQLAVALVFVFQRTIDADEGFYLAAAQRVADGMMPYVDFFFPQAPLMPFTFFALSGWGMTSLIILRICAALAGAAMTLVMYKTVREFGENDRLAIVAAFLVAFSGLFLTWHSTFKPYAFVDLALLGSFYFLIKGARAETSTGKIDFMAWLLLGVAINLRSIFLVLVPVYIYTLIARGKKSEHKSSILAAVAGILIPSLPALYLFAIVPSEFLFNNLGFHLQREPIEPLSALLLHKITVFGKFLALPQTILLVGAAIGSYVLVRTGQVAKSIMFKPALIFALIVGLVYLVPTPVHMQYFQQSLAYLIILSLPCVTFILMHDRLRTILKSAAVLYLVGVIPFLYLFILAPRENDHRFEWAQVSQVVDSIHRNSDASDSVLSEWAGYSALSQRPQIPGSEHVGFHFPLDLTASEYGAHHLLTNDAIVAMLSEQRPSLVVVDYKVYPEWEGVLNANYRLVDHNDQTYVYRRSNEAL